MPSSAGSAMHFCKDSDLDQMGSQVKGDEQTERQSHGHWLRWSDFILLPGAHNERHSLSGS